MKRIDKIIDALSFLKDIPIEWTHFGDGALMDEIRQYAEDKLGSNVKVTASATGGKTPYQYAVYYKQTSQTSWTCAQSYGTNTTLTITPKAATTYTVRVKVKDAAGTIVNKDHKITVTKE